MYIQFMSFVINKSKVHHVKRKCNLFPLIKMSFFKQFVLSFIDYIHSIFSTGTYSNLYNHPTLIKDPPKVRFSLKKNCQYMGSIFLGTCCILQLFAVPITTSPQTHFHVAIRRNDVSCSMKSCCT